MDWREYQNNQKIHYLKNRFISYIDEGSGHPIVLIHGIPTWGYLWHGLVQPLCKSGRVLIPDLLGYGYSDKSDRFDRGIDKQAEYLMDWFDELNLDRVSLVGHDIGGGIALRIAAMYPYRVSRLCVM